MPGSIVNYSFCTQQGDIDFGITFIPASTKGNEENESKEKGQEQGESDQKSEAAEVLEEHRVPSEVEPISGVFRSPQEGSVRPCTALYFITLLCAVLNPVCCALCCVLCDVLCCTNKLM